MGGVKNKEPIAVFKISTKNCIFYFCKFDSDIKVIKDFLTQLFFKVPAQWVTLAKMSIVPAKVLEFKGCCVPS